MRPCLVLMTVTACFASSCAFAQHPGGHAATPATALAARPAAAGSPTATAARSQSAFGRAMAELTRAARESRQAARADRIDLKGAAAHSPAAVATEVQVRRAVVATSTRSDP